jgi:type IV pilus assembly protein PilC
MPRFEYEAEKWNGEKVKGTMDAKSQIEVKVRVKNLGYKCLSVTELSKKNLETQKTGTLQSLSLKEKIDFTQTFLTLNQAGLPIIESLIFIEKDGASRQVRLLAQEIKKQIIAGYTLSDTISKS